MIQIKYQLRVRVWGASDSKNKKKRKTEKK